MDGHRQAYLLVTSYLLLVTSVASLSVRFVTYTNQTSIGSIGPYHYPIYSSGRETEAAALSSRAGTAGSHTGTSVSV